MSIIEDFEANQTIQKSPLGIHLQGRFIEPANSHKFLGIILDQELQLKEHSAYTLEKGTRWIQQLTSRD